MKEASLPRTPPAPEFAVVAVGPSIKGRAAREAATGAARKLLHLMMD
jgi:hypothetical protein